MHKVGWCCQALCHSQVWINYYCWKILQGLFGNTVFHLHRRNAGFWAAVAQQPTAAEKEKLITKINKSAILNYHEKEAAIASIDTPDIELRYHCCLTHYTTRIRRAYTSSFIPPSPFPLTVIHLYTEFQFIFIYYFSLDILLDMLPFVCCCAVVELYFIF